MTSSEASLSRTDSEGDGKPTRLGCPNRMYTAPCVHQAVLEIADKDVEAGEGAQLDDFGVDRRGDDSERRLAGFDLLP